MDEFEIMVGKNKLTEEEIKENEDFGQLLKKHQQIKLRKRAGIGGLLIAGVLLLSGIVYLNSENTKEPQVNEFKQEAQGLQSPLNITLNKDTLIVNNQEGGVFYYENTKIIIPENTFVDSLGQLIQGEVQLTYKEFHTPVEAFVSGIPMTYDSADSEFHFETAGMFEIRGYYQKKEIRIQETIQIEMASFQSGDYFNQYYFDEEIGNWSFIKKDSIQERDTLTKEEKKEIQHELKEVSASLARVEKKKPIRKTKNSSCVKLELDSNEFPEFILMKEVLFEIQEKDQTDYEKLAKTEWDDIKLIQKEEEIELHIFKRFKRKVLKVKPVYEGKSFDIALANYYAENGKIINSLKSKREVLSQRLNSFSNEVAYQADLGSFVTRLFTINDFGIFNSDCPQRMPKGQLITVEYLRKSESEEKDTLEIASLYLVEENKNALYTLRPSSTLSFNPNNKSVLWGVTIDNKLVIYKSKEFEKIPSNHEGVFNLELEVVEENLFSEKELIKKLEVEALFNSI